VDTVLCQCTVQSLVCVLWMALAQLYSTAFAISISTSLETSYSLRRRRRGPGCHFYEVFNGVIQLMRAVKRHYGPRPARPTLLVSIYITVNLQVQCVHTIRSILAPLKGNAITMLSRRLTVCVIFSYLYMTQAASFFTVPKHGSSLGSRDLQAINGSTRGQRLAQRDGFRSVAYYVVGSTVVVLSANRIIDVPLELGDIRSQAQSTRLTSRKAHARVIRIRQCPPGNRGSALDRS
jgi:hypothetical protein